MDKKKPKATKIRKFRFLLDTAFATPSVFKKLNKKTNLKHVRLDYHLSRETEDETIYNLAVREKRYVITQDDGFRKQIKKRYSAVFIIPSYLTNQQIDELICQYIHDKDPDTCIGKAIKLQL
ncbi:DUF5615 family PIN-like protein [Candidatus Gottesmanbacteria bacterium]|nr:DUF5615 family PIN-like protein [Candidatus Gottesmanbacteria bacterium]